MGPTVRIYLRELRSYVADLPNADDIVAEAADHLHTTIEVLAANGMPLAEAERTAIDRYGPARTVGRSFARAQGRHGAVATTWTQRAGLAAIGLVFLGLLDLVLPLSKLPVIGLVVETGGVALFVFTLWGIRVRHGRLGAWGRTAFWTAHLAVPLFVVFPRGAVVVIGVALVLAGIGLLRARILPPLAVGLALLVPGAAMVGFAITGGDMGLPLWSSSVASSSGFAWIGWAMWREPVARVTA